MLQLLAASTPLDLAAIVSSLTRCSANRLLLLLMVRSHHTQTESASSSHGTNSSHHSTSRSRKRSEVIELQLRCVLFSPMSPLMENFVRRWTPKVILICFFFCFFFVLFTFFLFFSLLTRSFSSCCECLNTLPHPAWRGTKGKTTRFSSFRERLHHSHMVVSLTAQTGSQAFLQLVHQDPSQRCQQRLILLHGARWREVGFYIVARRDPVPAVLCMEPDAVDAHRHHKNEQCPT